MTTSAARESGTEFTGTVEISDGEVQVAVQADLRGGFQPIDGLFHWYGRLASSPDLDALGSGSLVTLHTEHGSAHGRLSDVDPWGRLRIAGTGRPPF